MEGPCFLCHHHSAGQLRALGKHQFVLRGKQRRRHHRLDRLALLRRGGIQGSEQPHASHAIRAWLRPGFRKIAPPKSGEAKLQRVPERRIEPGPPPEILRVVRELRPEEIHQVFPLIGAANDIGDAPAARIDRPINPILRRLLRRSENSAVLVLRPGLLVLFVFRRFDVDGIQRRGLHGLHGELTPVRQSQRGELQIGVAKRSEIAVEDRPHPLPPGDGLNAAYGALCDRTGGHHLAGESKERVQNFFLHPPAATAVGARVEKKQGGGPPREKVGGIFYFPFPRRGRRQKKKNRKYTPPG